MRTAFVNAITKLAKSDKNVWLVNADLGFSVLESYVKDFPEQYVNCGVAEQNMIGISAGAALSGKTVFAYSIIPFITLRCLEQVRNDVCLQNANVKLVGVGEGFSYGQLGPTHHSIEDIAIMRALPNMTVICPGDPWEVEKAVMAATKIKSPVYIRLGKKGEPIINKETNYFKIGKGTVLAKGRDIALITTGNMLETGQVVRNNLLLAGKSVSLISMHTVKPLDKKLIINLADKTKVLVTLEEHNLIGGLSSAISEVLSFHKTKTNLLSFGVRDKYNKLAGDQDYIRALNGLSADKITKDILRANY